MKKFLLFLCLGFTILSSVPVMAQEETASPTRESVLMSPLNYRINLTPGSEGSAEFTLTNNTSTKLDFVLGLGEFEMQPDGSMLPISDSVDYLATGWLEFTPAEFDLDTNESETVKVTISIPEDALPKAYFPAVLSEYGKSNPKRKTNTTSTSLKVQTAFIVGINVVDALPSTTLEIVKLSITPDPVIGSEFTLEYKFKNPTVQFTKPLAHLQILSPTGQRIWIKTINDNLSTLAPGGEMGEILTLNQDDLDLSAVGIYRAELLVTDDQFGTADILTLDFWVIPLWGLIIGSAAVFLLLLLLVIYLVRQARARRMRQQSHEHR